MVLPKPPALPAPQVDLSDFTWTGRTADLPEGVTTVGDGWDAPSLPPNSNPSLPGDSDTETESDTLPIPHPTSPSLDSPPHPVPAPDPVQPPAGTRRRHQTELEMLGPPPIIDGPR